MFALVCSWFHVEVFLEIGQNVSLVWVTKKVSMANLSVVITLKKVVKSKVVALQLVCYSGNKVCLYQVLTL